MKALFISYPQDDSVSGGAKTSLRNLAFLKKYCGDDNVYRISINHHDGIIKKYITKSFNLSKNELNEIEGKINEGYNILFIDYTYGGDSFYNLKKKYPHIVIIKFFHDINAARYMRLKKLKSIPYLSLRHECRFKYAIHYKASIKSDIKITQCSDVIITLHERDSKALNDLYGREADFYMPISLPDPQIGKEETVTPITNDDRPSILFVGSLKYAPNMQAVKFLIPIAEKTDWNICVIGDADGSIKQEINSEYVKLLGRQKDLSPFYNSCNIIALPIFSGGGMKVKTCEALSYGKTILGTSESFVGYDVDYTKVGALCDSEEQFTEALCYFRNNIPLFNSYSKQVFLEKYSDDAVYQVFSAEMNKHCNKGEDDMQ